MQLTANATLSSPKLLWLPRQSNLSRKPDEHPARLLNQPWRFPCQQPHWGLSRSLPMAGACQNRQEEGGRMDPSNQGGWPCPWQPAQGAVSGHPHSIVSPARPMVGLTRRVGHFLNLPPGKIVGFCFVGVFLEQSLQSFNLNKLTLT